MCTFVIKMLNQAVLCTYLTFNDPGRKSCQDPIFCRILHRILAGLPDRERLTGSHIGSCWGPIREQDW